MGGEESTRLSPRRRGLLRQLPPAPLAPLEQTTSLFFPFAPRRLPNRGDQFSLLLAPLQVLRKETLAARETCRRYAP